MLKAYTVCGFVIFVDYMQSFSVHYLQYFTLTYYFCWIVVKHWLLVY